MEEGKIYEVVWDNGCFDCDTKCDNSLISYSVFNSTISQKYENCFENDLYCSSGNSTECDPKFYVTWAASLKRFSTGCNLEASCKVIL